MHQTTTSSRLKVFCLKITAILLFFVSVSNISNAQVTITSSGANYISANYRTGDAAITFAVTNNNSSAVTLTEVDCAWNTTATPGPANATLWYSATDLSGTPTIAAPVWTAIVTGVPITVSANGVIPTFTGLSFSIPGATTYRFAIESDNGINYSGSTAGPNPTTNLFSSSGIDLEVGDFQGANGNVGYSVTLTPFASTNPRFFRSFHHAGTLI